MIEFDRRDVERHPVVGQVLELYGEDIAFDSNVDLKVN
jgi:hypothetical protein